MTDLSTESSPPTTSPFYPQARTLDDFVRNLAAVRLRLANACRGVGRHPDEVRLLPVSKTVDEARIRLASTAGCREFAENKVQEASHKWKAMVDLPDMRWSMIGHLQTNKVKAVARFANEVQTLDSLRHWHGRTVHGNVGRLRDGHRGRRHCCPDRTSHLRCAGAA